MKRKIVIGWIVLLLLAPVAMAQTQLRIFVGGQQRPDVMKEILAIYEKQNPGVKVEIEVGGATSEQQQQYLTTVLTSRDSALDVILIDVIRPAQYAAAGWAEPLDRYLSAADKQQLLSRYLPAYAEADQVNGVLYALPSFADAMFLYYRKDLLDKYNLQPPKTWEELVKQAQTILAGEKNPGLQGLSYQGAAIEGAVCTFLVPFWGAGGELIDTAGRVQVDSLAAAKGFQFWLDTVRQHKITKPNVAEIRTDDTRKDFQAGNVVFAVLWAYGWNHFQSADSHVKDKVGVVPLPTFAGGKPATCLGGWQWSVSAFSRHKEEAYKLLRYLSSPAVSKILALKASNLPVFPEVYKDPDVLKANPWFEQALPVVMTARSRPVTPRYTEVSDTIRANVNAVLAGIKTPDVAIKEIQNRLAQIFRQ